MVWTIWQTDKRLFVLARPELKDLRNRIWRNGRLALRLFISETSTISSTRHDFLLFAEGPSCSIDLWLNRGNEKVLAAIPYHFNHIIAMTIVIWNII